MTGMEKEKGESGNEVGWDGSVSLWKSIMNHIDLKLMTLHSSNDNGVPQDKDLFASHEVCFSLAVTCNA